MNRIKMLSHPQHGECKTLPDKLAVFWKTNVSKEQKSNVLEAANLQIIEISETEFQIAVNNTDQLNWVKAKKGSIADKDIETLENAGLTEWVSYVFKAANEEQAKVSEAYDGLFTIHPGRILVEGKMKTEDEVKQNISASLSIDHAKSANHRNHTVLKIDSPSLSKDNSVFNLVGTANAKAKELPSFQFENIPFFSPLCCGCNSGNVTGLKKILPNDPMFSTQWGLERINAPYAWSVTQGDPEITVAVLDQGVQLNHPDLSLHPDSWNTSTNIPDGSPTGNHGTACAGIVAAKINNGQGVAGVAGKCRIMAISTATWSDADIAEGLHFAADHGAKVVSMSFGVYPGWGWNYQIVQDALQYAYDKGLVLVAASGNENIPESRFPGNDARTICVGGTNREDKRKAKNDTSIETFWGACYGNALDVCAPCLEIPTTDRLGTLGYSATDYYDRFNGTSSATPHVAGLAALILSANKTLANETVREIIESTCDKVRTDVYTYTNVGFKFNGTWNNEVGYGRINAERALALACDNKKHPGTCCSCTEEYVSLPDLCDECVAPPAPGWQPFNQCMYWYENRYVQKLMPIKKDLQSISNIRGNVVIQFKITYEHRVCMIGRQQGALLFTTTLLPNEEVKIYQNDRYRRTKSESQRMSVHASLRQTTSALWQSKISNSESRFTQFLENVRGDGDANASVGGSLFDFSFKVDDPDTNININVNQSTNSVNEEFNQTLKTSSQLVEAERSFTVSTFEDTEHATVTSRTLKNFNDCRAVTYFVRRVNETYHLTTRVTEISWRVLDKNNFTPWRSLNDLSGVSNALRELINRASADLPKIGEEISTPHPITVPTDGALYEAELAHCSSCDPERQAEVHIRIEKAKAESRKLCLEAEMLTLEIERRRKLIEQGKLDAFEIQSVVNP